VLILDYQACYRDVIDQVLQREVLAQHYAPELRDLFEGENLERLRALADGLREQAAHDSADEKTLRQNVGEELERYLRERRLPHYPKAASFYLDYYRNWVAPYLLGTTGSTMKE
jgi:hypothetical protein